MTTVFKTGFNLLDQLLTTHTAVRIYRGRAQHTGRRGGHHCGVYILGQDAAHRAQEVPHIFVSECSRVCNCYTMLTYAFKFLGLLHK